MDPYEIPGGITTDDAVCRIHTTVNLLPWLLSFGLFLHLLSSTSFLTFALLESMPG